MDKANIQVVSNDGFAQASWTYTMTQGLATLPLFSSPLMRTAGIRDLTTTDQSGTQPLLGGITSSTFTLVASNPP